ncbi:MAG: hypothetical protein U1F44_02820 [Coriobacteriia bacterium]|nr:hypothetical protein [Coriobacteriia bacterium]
MSQAQLLIDATRALDAAGVGYLLTGSIASSLQGEPRASHDVDIVIEVDVRVIVALASAFGTDRYFFDEIAAAAALDDRGMFNLIDTRSGDKVDFWMLTEHPFDRSRFDRRVTTQAFGARLCVSSPEDTILQKLRWADASGGSERHVWDALGVYEVNHGVLDESYLDTWAAALGVSDLLSALRNQFGGHGPGGAR